MNIRDQLTISAMRRTAEKTVRNISTRPWLINKYLKEVTSKQTNLSLIETAEIVKEDYKRAGFSHVPDEQVLKDHSLLSWLTTKRIYSLDQDLQDLLLSKDVDNFNAITMDMLLKIPEFSLLIYCPFVFENFKCYGFSVGLVVDPDIPEDWPDDEEWATHRLVISIEFVDVEGRYQSLLTTLEVGKLDSTLEETLQLDSHGYGSILKSLPKLFSILAYFCSDNFKDNAEYPKLSFKDKQQLKGKLQVPPNITVVKTGGKDGELIRKFNIENKKYEGERRGMRPHIRRAHWHSYWVGPAENKVKVLKFITNTFVNVKDVN